MLKSLFKKAPWRGRGETDADAILRKSIPEPNSGCWLWMGCVDSNGYGQTARKLERRTTLAHIVSYECFVGKVSSGLELDHLCRVRCCVNPEHLEAVTHKINARRGTSPWIVNAKKMYCVNGHEFTEGNTRRKKSNGNRQCRVCLMHATRRYRERQKCLSV